MWEKKHIFIMFYMAAWCLGGCAIFFIKSFITSAASLTFFSSFVCVCGGGKSILIVNNVFTASRWNVIKSRAHCFFFTYTDKLKSQDRNYERES